MLCNRNSAAVRSKFVFVAPQHPLNGVLGVRLNSSWPVPLPGMPLATTTRLSKFQPELLVIDFEARLLSMARQDEATCFMRTYVRKYGKWLQGGLATLYTWFSLSSGPIRFAYKIGIAGEAIPKTDLAIVHQISGLISYLRSSRLV